MCVVPGVYKKPVALLQHAVQHVGAVGPVGVGSDGQVVVVDLDGVHGVERGQPVGRREREVVEPGCSMVTNAPHSAARRIAPAWSSAGGASKSSGMPAAVTQ